MKSNQSIHAVKAGVIGTGFIGPVHVEALRRLGVTVTAICDVADLGAKAAARLAIPQAFADYRDLLACPEVDVVHITTPNRFHCEMSLAALRAGKHVVCEKPLAMNTRETARIVQAAQAVKRVFAVNYNVRFYPAVLALRRLVERGDLPGCVAVAETRREVKRLIRDAIEMHLDALKDSGGIGYGSGSAPSFNTFTYSS